MLCDVYIVCVCNECFDCNCVNVWWELLTRCSSVGYECCGVVHVVWLYKVVVHEDESACVVSN